MIVRQFLRWIQTAPAADRAEATAALARAYLHGDLTGEDMATAEAALITLTDDPSPVVRMALAETMAASAETPQTLLIALLQDQPEIAAIVAERSPLLIDAELVDLAAVAHPLVQYAIAIRPGLPAPVAAALAEVGCVEACLVLVTDRSITLPPFSLNRIVGRFGADADMRNALLSRPDLSAAARQSLVRDLAQVLTRFVVDRKWLSEDRAERVAREATEKATVTIATSDRGAPLTVLVRHLRDSGQLTTGLVLRALLSGQMGLFESSLAELSGLDSRRASGLVHDHRGAGFRALYDRAGLPRGAFAAFAAALDAYHGSRGDVSLVGAPGLHRRMVERALTAYLPFSDGELDSLVALLRRFATEAARDEARAFTADLIAGQDAVDDEMAGPLAA